MRRLCKPCHHVVRARPQNRLFPPLFTTRNMPVVELESLLSSPKRTSMTLIISRGDLQRTFTIELAQGADVLRDNHWQFVNGKLVPLWVPEKYQPCFE